MEEVVRGTLEQLRRIGPSERSGGNYGAANSTKRYILNVES